MAPAGFTKFVSSQPSARSRARNSKTSRVHDATSRASSEPSSHGYSRFSMYVHVGPSATISRPSRAAAARLFTLSRIRARAWSIAPPSRYGIPQQRCSGSATSTPCRSRTRTAARPTAGWLYSTEQVANRATRGIAASPDRAAPGASAAPGRDARWRRVNHRVNVSRWNFGRLRSLWMPATACTKARCTASSFAQFESGAVRLPSLPTRSVFPSNLF